MTNRLAEVYALGQSPWCDTIARDQIRQGTFELMIERDAIVGVTSNPSLFQKAMTVGSAYDEQFRDLAAQQLDALSIYQIMANQDIRDVLALFRPVYDRTHGIDGYVSLEVSPLLAYETQKTIVEAKQLWTHLNQPNLFIKIPGTAATINAFQDHGSVALTVEQDVAAARQVMQDLDTVGIPIKQVTDSLEQEGVATFKTAFEDLLQKLDDKRRALAQEQAAQGDASAEVAARSGGRSGGVAGANSTPATKRAGEEPAKP